jgi:general nucleoside transport system ATP-binding protein
MLRLLKSQNKTVIFITHKLREIMRLTDRVSVMRRGEMVATFETANTSPPELADAMVGRKVILRIEKGAAHPGEIALEARNLVVRDDRGVTRVDDVSFTLRRGEIVGIAGVAGNGQSELLEALAGIRALASGEIILDGAAPAPQQRNPKAIRRLGVSHVPEDRHRMGLVMPFQACESAMLGFQDDEIYGRGILFDRRAIVEDEARKMEAFDIRPRAPLLKTANFSGGNQQKIVLAREIERNPHVMLVGQPTRGVDIGAIEFIHKRLVALRDAGKAVLLVSVELDEIMALSDRILVICAGRITGERRPEETNQQDLGLLMAGVSEHAA